MVQGRKPNLERRRRIQQFRDRGLSLPAIGRRLGVTFQCVQRTLRRMTKERPGRVPCCACGEDIVSPGACASDHGQALCLRCLAERPDAPFGQRLRAFRLAAGPFTGVTYYRGALLPPGGRGEIGDFEPEKQDVYRVNGVLVQAMWDYNAQAFTVSDGNSKKLAPTNKRAWSPPWNALMHFTRQPPSTHASAFGSGARPKPLVPPVPGSRP